MEVRTDPVVLWARALLLAVVGVFLGVAGHVTADGLLPGPLVLGVLLVVSVVACASLLARPASTLRIVVLLVGGQAAVHLVLTVSGGHVGDPTTATHRAPTGLGGSPADGRRAPGRLAPGVLRRRPSAPGRCHRASRWATWSPTSPITRR